MYDITSVLLSRQARLPCTTGDGLPLNPAPPPRSLCSMFIVRSCDGFSDGRPQILCCSESACRRYTETEYSDTGFPLPPSAMLPLPHLACFETDPDFPPRPPPQLPTGPSVPPGEEPTAVASVRAVNFGTWPTTDIPPIVAVDETAIAGRVPIRSFQTGVLPGAFSLNTAEATRLAELVLSQLVCRPRCCLLFARTAAHACPEAAAHMSGAICTYATHAPCMREEPKLVQPEVPAEEAEEVQLVSFPGIEARGRSMGVGRGPRAQRIPTVYAPFSSGYKFRIDDSDGETAVVNLSNMTLLVPNATYDGLGDSGLLAFFGLDGGQPKDLVCVQNRYAPPARCVLCLLALCCECRRPTDVR